jgi:hypothetical protein
MEFRLLLCPLLEQVYEWLTAPQEQRNPKWSAYDGRD